MSELFPVNQKIGLFEKYKHVVLIGEFSSQEENIKTRVCVSRQLSLGMV